MEVKPENTLNLYTKRCISHRKYMTKSNSNIEEWQPCKDHTRGRYATARDLAWNERISDRLKRSNPNANVCPSFALKRICYIGVWARYGRFPMFFLVLISSGCVVVRLLFVFVLNVGVGNVVLAGGIIVSFFALSRVFTYTGTGWLKNMMWLLGSYWLWSLF